MSRKSRQKRLMTMSQEERLILHVPNKVHLDNCRQGSRVYRNKKKYTRKGKAKFDARKWY